jgi:myo-inositol 2-dehydrogenase/D-chiro-inositol 1-dehydrogenase
MIKMTSRDSPLPPLEYLKISNGIYHDCAVHDIDIITWIFGERPLSVYTAAHSFIKEIEAMNDVDTLVVVLKFPSGGMGLVDISRFASFGYDQRCEVFGGKGMLVQHNYQPSNVQFSGESGSSTGRIYHSFPERYAESYVKALDHFVDVIQGKCTAEITKESTLLASEIVEACEQSRKTGQAVLLPQ